MPDNDCRVAHPREKALGRRKALVLASIPVIVVALVKLAIGFFLGPQILSSCADPGGCTNTPIFVVVEDGVLNSAGWLLIAGAALLAAGILLLAWSKLRLRRVRDQG